jgi:hypothetical protein
LDDEDDFVFFACSRLHCALGRADKTEDEKKVGVSCRRQSEGDFSPPSFAELSKTPSGNLSNYFSGKGRRCHFCEPCGTPIKGVLIPKGERNEMKSGNSSPFIQKGERKGDFKKYPSSPREIPQSGTIPRGKFPSPLEEGMKA